ncbi:hypothetical protein O3G_MSEX014675 [Manduca sexta]|uniref:Uncharacterized protein n=1 Tax=Manduca sexta TaxID=7130 RepID=A0A921ZUF0_MANSE|nr:hypothetical protein O3G_MSEX014675 [Manduca sexta]
MEAEHYPYGHRPATSLAIAGTKYEVPYSYKTPDFRYEERPFAAYSYLFYREEERPYRFSPFYKSYLRWDYDRPRWFQRSNDDNPYYFGCYCTTVYKRLTPLGGCAIITTRHLLTTATSTELILKDHREDHTLEDILGAWYDHNANVFNSSMYMTPARIHYHPMTDWGWFHCANVYWAKFGLDSGAAWHRALEGYGWRYDGLIALASLAMKLRSIDLVGYFTVLDSHPVLDFLYSAYMGWFKCEYLDWRFYDSSGRAPIPKPWFYIPWNYYFGAEVYEGYTLPFY